MNKFLLIPLFICIFGLSGCSRVGNSERTGTIVKISSEGFINRTTEVEIIKGSLNGASGAFGSKFDFTIPNGNQNLLSIANYAFNQGKEVVVTYHSDAFCPLSSGNNGCIFADNISINK